MSDSYSLVGNQVIPYTSGRKSNDTNTYRDATELELEQQQIIQRSEEKIQQLVEALEGLIGANTKKELDVMELTLRKNFSNEGDLNVVLAAIVILRSCYD